MPPCCRSRSQGLPMPIWSCNEWGRYWVNTATSEMPELTQLLRAKSMMRYLPANGTAGLARFCERRLNRSPWPPARMMASTLLIAQRILSVWEPYPQPIDRDTVHYILGCPSQEIDAAAL